MKRLPHFVITALLTAFSLLTIFMSTSVIFDLFGIREREGNYVLFIVWANFACGILYLVASVGLLKRQRWASAPMIIALVILVLALGGLVIHIATGGIYETKTIFAMIFRIAVTAVFAWLIYSGTNRHALFAK